MLRVERVSLIMLVLTGCLTHSEVDAGEEQDGTLDDVAIDDGAIHDGAIDGAPGDAAHDGASDTDGEVVPLPDPRHPIIPCGNYVYKCADGLDNDGDGLIDSDDPDCFGPCDNNEVGYFAAQGLHDNVLSCTFDCYFDENYGSGGGDCQWDVRCDPASPGSEWGFNCAHDPDFATFDCVGLFETQYESRATCQENCEYRVPNGCDCFGCCHFPTSTSQERHVLIGSWRPGTYTERDCNYEEAVDENTTLCAECTPVPSCYKECGRCELCLGKLTLPDDCTEEEVAGRCGEEKQVCGLPGDEPCEENFYCLSGCCVQFVFPD